MNDHESAVLFSGYAKLPTGITASEMYKVICIVVVIDMNNGIILDADCTLATSLAKNYVSSMLCHQTLEHGPDSLIQDVERLYQGSAKKAIITALRIIYDKYRTYKEGRAISVIE